MFQCIVGTLDGAGIASQAIPYAARIPEPGARIALVGVVERQMDAFFASGSAERPALLPGAQPAGARVKATLR